MGSKKSTPKRAPKRQRGNSKNKPPTSSPASKRNEFKKKRERKITPRKVREKTHKRAKIEETPENPEFTYPDVHQTPNRMSTITEIVSDESSEEQQFDNHGYRENQNFSSAMAHGAILASVG